MERLRQSALTLMATSSIAKRLMRPTFLFLVFNSLLVGNRRQA